MRALRVLGWTCGGLLALVTLVMLAAQTMPGRRLIAGAISEAASNPQRQVVLRGLGGFFPTDLIVDQFELKDGAGAWFRADKVRLRWSLASLLSGRLQIEALSADRLEALRPPMPAPPDASSAGGSGGLPLEVDLASLSVGDLHVAAALGGVDSHWSIQGAALLATDKSRVKATMKRTDGASGSVDADMTFDLAPFSIEGEIVAAEESKGGIVAALVERPDLDRVSLRLKASGGPDAGSLDLTAGAQDVASSTGRLEWRREGTRTRFSWHIDGKAPGLPDSPGARLIRQSLKLDGAAVLDGKQVLTVDHADVEAGPARLSLTGRYDPRGERLDATIDLATDEAAEIADLLVAPASAARAPLAGPAEVKVKIALRGGGRVRTAIDVADLRPLSAFGTGGIAGRAHLEIEGVTGGTDARGSLKGTLQGLTVPGVPPELSRQVRLEGAGTFRQGEWILRSAAIATDDLMLEAEGRGRSSAGELHLSLDAPRTQALLADYDGDLKLRANLFFGEDGMRGDADAGGTLKGKPLSLKGRFAHDGSGFSIPELEGSWASASVQASDLVMTPIGATGHARLEVKRLADFAAVPEFSSLEAKIDGDGRGFDVDLKASGPRAGLTLAARAAPDGGAIQTTVSRFEGRYDGLPLKLVAPARLQIAGAHVAVENAAFDLGGGKVIAKGVVDPANSNLAVDVAGLPLKLVQAVAPGNDLDGTLQAKLQVRGPLAAPRIDATYSASGVRVKRPGTSLLPSLAAQGKAQLSGNQATFDVALSAGGGGTLQARGRANLAATPSATVALTGNLNVAPFAPLLGTSVNNIAGALRPDVTLEIAGSRIAGRGTVAVSGIAFVFPATGMSLSGGNGTLSLQGDSLQIERLAFRTTGNGEMTATGRIGLDPTQGMPVDLTLVTRRALLVKRTDLTAIVSSNLKISGALAKGLDVSGPITIDRAEIAVGAEQAADYPTVAVREVNGGKPVAAAAVPARAPSSPLAVRLALDVQAPRAVFVRGRGLDAEVGGSFKVNGDAAKPAVIGGLALRRGELSFAGKRLVFSRGNVSLMNVNTIDPRLDFAASTNVSGTTITVTVTGTPRAPSINITSSPELPSDEAMAMLLFGKPASMLSVTELLTAAQALAELTGVGSSGGGFFGRLRRGLGLDQLSVDTSSATSGGKQGIGGTTVQGGKYVTPGIYVGAKQGASADTSRGVVEIEVFPHAKLEGDIGADSNGRLGAKIEWDY